MFKKAQVTMETIFIYGIVAIVVLSGIGALMYFGVLDFGSYLPDQFKLSGDIQVPEFSFIGDGNTLIQLGIENRNAKVLTINAIELTQPEDAAIFNSTSVGTLVANCTSRDGFTHQLPPKKITAVNLNCSLAADTFNDQKMALNVKIMYRNQGGAVDQTASGTATVTIN